MWSKIKQILRSLSPRTDAELLAAAKLAFNAITPADCHGFFFTRPIRYMIYGNALNSLFSASSDRFCLLPTGFYNSGNYFPDLC